MTGYDRPAVPEVALLPDDGRRARPVRRATGTDVIRGWMPLLSLGIAALFLVCQVMIQSTFTGLFPPAVTQLCIAGSFGALLAGAAIAFAQGQLLAVGAFAVVMMVLFVQCHVFAAITGGGVSLNILGSYLTMAAFPLFTIRTLPLNRYFQIFFAVSIIYCAIYALRYDHFVDIYKVAAAEARRLKPSGAITVSGGVRVLPGDAVRDVRVYLAGTFATFALFYCLVNLRGRFALRWIAGLGIAVAAIVLSASRVYIAILTVVTLAYWLRLTHREHRVLFAALFVILAIVIVLGVPFSGLNPFSIAAGDDSGAIRARAYEIISRLVSQHFILGVGIAPNSAAQTEMIGLPSVFPADLGTLGVWFTFGLIGLIVYIVEVVLVMIGPARQPDLSPIHHKVLVLSGVTAGLGSWMSPDIWGGATGLIAAITMGLIMRNGLPQRIRYVFWLGTGYAPLRHARALLNAGLAQLRQRDAPKRRPPPG